MYCTDPSNSKTQNQGRPLPLQKYSPVTVQLSFSLQYTKSADLGQTVAAFTKECPYLLSLLLNKHREVLHAPRVPGLHALIPKGNISSEF